MSNVVRLPPSAAICVRLRPASGITSASVITTTKRSRICSLRASVAIWAWLSILVMSIATAI